MKKNLVYLFAFATLSILAGLLMGLNLNIASDSAWAGEEESTWRKKANYFMQRKSRSPKGRKENFAQMLVAKLELSQEQEAELNQILEKTRQEIKEAREDFRAAIAEIKETKNSQIENILNFEQQEKFKELKANFEEKRKKRERVKEKKRLMPKHYLEEETKEAEF